jgi:hypothetical protein
MRGQCGLHLGPLSASGLGCAKTPESNLRAEILARFRQFESQKCLRPLWEKTIEKTILRIRGSGSFLRSQGHWVEPDSSPETFRPSGGRTGSLGEAGYRVGFLEQWSHTAQSASPPRPDLADLDRKVRFGATKERNGTASTHPRAGRSSTPDVQGQILVWTNCSSLHPFAEQRARLRLRTGSGLTAGTRRPGPTHQMIGADMLHNVIERAAAVARGILDLRANLPDRLAFPAHFARRQMPSRVAGHAAGIEIRLLMTDRTAQRRKAEAVFTANDRRLMRAAEIALARAIAGRMAVHAARMSEHSGGFGEQGR